MSAAMSEEEATIEEVIEPYLIQLGLLERTARGRVATEKAYEHLALAVPANLPARLDSRSGGQNKLL